MRMIRLVPLFALALLASACQSSPARAPCADFDCSGHGTCTLAQVASEQIPTCLCDTGYSPSSSGWLCLPSSDTSLCAGVTCSGHGKCVSVKGLPRCTCDSGYSASSDGKSCLDPCASVACSGHGTCKAGTCSCDKGYRPSLDGKACETSGPASVVTYKLTLAQYGSYSLGTSSLEISASTLVERTAYRINYGHGGRALGRKSQQRLTLDASGQDVVALDLDDEIEQGSISRRRFAQASLGPSSASVTLQRRKQTSTVSRTYSGTRRPLPMHGEFEYPGWTFGCFSPAFYMLALKRYAVGAQDPQTIDVLYPESGEVGQVRVRAGAAWTATRPVLEFPDEQVTVTYASGIPESMVLGLQGYTLTWTRTSALVADLNLGDLPAATPYAPAPLPADIQESTVSFSSADGTLLEGTLARPKSASSPTPAVLLVADAWASGRDAPYFLLPQPLYRHLAAHLGHAGYASLRYDARGRGKSQGDIERARHSQLVADAAAALAALKGVTGVDASQVYVLSHGAGSLVALGLLRQAGSSVKGYLALAPLLRDLEEAIVFRHTEHLSVAGLRGSFLSDQQKYYKDSLGKVKAGTYTDQRFLGVGVPYWRDLLDLNGPALLAAYAGPVLALRGDEDLDLPLSGLEALQAAAGKAGKSNLSTTRLPGLTHLLAEGRASGLLEEAVLPLEVATPALEAIVDWLDER